MTLRFLKLFFFTVILATSAADLAYAKKYDATLSYIIYDTGRNDNKSIVKELSKNFSIVQPFELTKKTNFYLHYFLTDENFTEYETTKRDNEDLTGDDVVYDNTATGHVGSARYETYKKRMKFSTQFSSGSRGITVSVVTKPFKGTMVLYNAYGTELIRVESKENFKTENGALKNTISQMRRAIDRQSDKMAIKQKLRCLFCDYNELRERQKNKVLDIAYISHSEQLNQLYGEITQTELPIGLVPYANIYSAQKNYKSLEHIIDTDAVIFDNQPGTKNLPGHLINEVLKDDAPERLITKIAAAYKKNDFQEQDQNNHTPLWSAISQRDATLVKKLIALDVDINQTSSVNNSYLTPLMISAQTDSPEITQLLLDSGAKKELTTPSGFTAWSTAMWLAKYDQAELLWPSEPSDVNVAEVQNLINQAAYFGQYEKVQHLLSKGVPATSRGVGGDNIVISAIKGIKTFAIETDHMTPGATLHKADSQVYWNVIGEAEKAEIDNPITTSNDSLGQTVLFHAYPDGENTVKDDHMKLISKLIQNGVDPKISNINGQNADQAYLDARMTYLDGLYESELQKINQDRSEAAQLAQLKQEKARDEALETIDNQGSFKARSRARLRAKRLQALDDADNRVRVTSNGVIDSESTAFERYTSDVDQTYDSDEAKKIMAQEIRDIYANDLKIASNLAKQKIDDLSLLIENLKQVEIDNAKSRMEQIARLNVKAIKTTSN